MIHYFVNLFFVIHTFANCIMNDVTYSFMAEDNTGWPITMFTQDEKQIEEFLCPVCCNVCRDAVIIPCKHLFCRYCIETWMKHCTANRNGYDSDDSEDESDVVMTCPLCRFEIESNDQLVCDERINALEVRCEHTSMFTLVSGKVLTENCSWTGVLSRFDGHHCGKFACNKVGSNGIPCRFRADYDDILAHRETCLALYPNTIEWFYTTPMGSIDAKRLTLHMYPEKMNICLICNGPLNKKCIMCILKTNKKCSLQKSTNCEHVFHTHCATILKKSKMTSCHECKVIWNGVRCKRMPKSRNERASEIDQEQLLLENNPTLELRIIDEQRTKCFTAHVAINQHNRCLVCQKPIDTDFVVNHSICGHKTHSHCVELGGWSLCR